MSDYKYDYKYPSSVFDFEDIKKDQFTRKKEVVVYEESKEIKFEHIYQQFMNSIYEKIEEGDCFNFKYVEKSLLQEILKKFNRTQTAKIMGVSIRTIRNKIKEYGLKDIRINNTNLH